jgi:hypothetical protein
MKLAEEIKLIQAGADAKKDDRGKSQTVSCDSKHPVARKFKTLYTKHAQSGDDLTKGLKSEGVKVVSDKAGFGGSGKAKYEFNDHKFGVNRSANGSGYDGTQHTITHEGKIEEKK